MNRISSQCQFESIYFETEITYSNAQKVKGLCNWELRYQLNNKRLGTLILQVPCLVTDVRLVSEIHRLYASPPLLQMPWNLSNLVPRLFCGIQNVILADDSRLKVRVHTTINRANFVTWCMLYTYEGNKMHLWENDDVLSWLTIKSHSSGYEIGPINRSV